MSKFHVGIQTQMLMLLIPHLMSHFSHINSDFWVKTVTCEQFSVLGFYHEIKNKPMVKNPEKRQPEKFLGSEELQWWSGQRRREAVRHRLLSFPNSHFTNCWSRLSQGTHSPTKAVTQEHELMKNLGLLLICP